MALEQLIEAVRNRKTQKLFIIVDDSLETRYKVINPAGEVLVLPDLLFDEDPVSVPTDKHDAEFTAEQLDAFSKYLEKLAAQAKAAAERPPPKPTRVEPKVVPPKARSTGRREPRETQTRRGVGAAWSAPRLTFYKHKIEPLHPKQTFRVTVEGIGTFEISKEDFMAQFNDAVMSPSYRADGLYTYPKLPEKAMRYLKN